jgi:pimeloyl-[acyl-carrier protein] methyl ester esterase
VTRHKLWYIPGWGSALDGSCALLTDLRKAFDVDVVWLPEYGNAGAGAPTQAIYAEAVAGKLIREQEPVTLIGWSIGGMVALEVAAMVPSAINGLVLLSATAKFCSDEDRPFGPSPETVLKMRDDLSPATLRRFFINCYHPSKPQPSEIETRVREAMAATSEQLQLGLTYLIQADLRPLLPQLSMPVLTFHGEQDAVIPVQAIGELARTVRTNPSSVLACTGHMLPHICADKLSGPIIRFAGPDRLF